MHFVKMSLCAGLLLCTAACGALPPAVLIGIGAGIAACLEDPACFGGPEEGGE